MANLVHRRHLILLQLLSTSTSNYIPPTLARPIHLLHCQPFKRELYHELDLLARWRRKVRVLLVEYFSRLL